MTKNSEGGNSPRGPAAGLDWAEARIGTSGYGGMCLQFTREAYGIGAYYNAAIDAWNGAKHKHSTSSTSGIPEGVPVFFGPHGSPYGHIAVYAGDGMMVTTHASSNRIQKDHVSTWTHDYGYDLLGWAEDLNGVRIVDYDHATEEEDMPKDATHSTSENFEFPADDHWHGIPLAHDSEGGKIYTLVSGHAQVSGELAIMLYNASGHKVIIRSVHNDGHGDSYFGFPNEYEPHDHDTALVYPFTARLAEHEMLRFQIKVYGNGGTLTIGSAKARALYWPL